MQFLLGLLTAVAFFSLVAVALFIGYKFGQKRKPAAPDDEETKKAAQLHEDFVKLMNYNESIALQRKKVE